MGVPQVQEKDQSSGGVIGRRVAISTLDKTVGKEDIDDGRVPSFLVTAAIGTVTRRIPGTDAYTMQVLGSNNEQAFPYLESRAFQKEWEIQLDFLSKKRHNARIIMARRLGQISQRTADLARSGIQITTQEIDPDNPVGRVLVVVESTRRDG